MIQNDHTWPALTESDLEVTSFHRKWAVEGRELAFWVHFSSYRL